MKDLPSVLAFTQSPDHAITPSLNPSMFLRVLAARKLRLKGIGLILQLLNGADLRAVIGLDNRALEDAKLLKALREVRARRPVGHERQDFVLLGACEPREGLRVFREAVAVEPSQRLEILLLRVGSFGGEI